MWSGYEFLDNIHSGYHHIKYNHGRGQFGLGLQSTSHIEAIWGILKQKIKSTYNVIPSKNIMHFITEAEFKYIIKNKNFYVTIKEFFSSYKLLCDISDTEIPHTEFLSDNDMKLILKILI